MKKDRKNRAKDRNAKERENKMRKENDQKNCGKMRKRKKNERIFPECLEN